MVEPKANDSWVPDGKAEPLKAALDLFSSMSPDVWLYLGHSHRHFTVICY